MNRRDLFLLFSAGNGERIARLSCQRLYMCYHDASIRQGMAGQGPANEADDWWLGEPESVLASASSEDLFKEAAGALAGVDVVVVEDSDWVKDAGFSVRVRALLDEFESGGGRITIRTPVPERQAERA